MNGTMTEKPFFTKLENRGLIALKGVEALPFLQALITNDMALLSAETLVYGCLLTPQGKFLHDFFICEQDDEILIDCEGGKRIHDLYKRLMMYRLRSAVEIEIRAENTAIYAVFGESGYGLPDPRHSAMGYRSFERPDHDKIEERPFSAWDERRINLCIPDGSRDLVVGNSTMDEARMDTLHAISYSKGCYVGQELTARMHYRGLGKKHLQMVDTANLPDGAELRSHCGAVGLALVRG